MNPLPIPYSFSLIMGYMGFSEFWAFVIMDFPYISMVFVLFVFILCCCCCLFYHEMLRSVVISLAVVK